MTNWKSYTGFPTSDQPRFYAAPNFFINGDQIRKFVVLHTISTIKDEKSAAKFHYNKTSAVPEMGDRLAIGMGRKWGEAALGAESPSNTLWPGPRPTSLPSSILIHPTVWPQL